MLNQSQQEQQDSSITAFSWASTRKTSVSLFACTRDDDYVNKTCFILLMRSFILKVLHHFSAKNLSEDKEHPRDPLMYVHWGNDVA